MVCLAELGRRMRLFPWKDDEGAGVQHADAIPDCLERYSMCNTAL